MASKLIELSAIPVDEKHRRDAFVILSARQAPPVVAGLPQRFSLLGEAEPGELRPQLPYRFWGRWDRPNDFGEQFRFESFASVQPHGKQGIVKYLQQARHIGGARAEALWDEFGGDAVRVLRETPDQAAAVAHITVERAAEAAADLHELAAAENLTIQLYDLFDGRGFGKSCVRQAIKLWGAEAFDVLTRDPYRAMALRGIGFLKADKFYLDLGKPPQKLKRQAYSLTYAVTRESDQQGHVWVPVETGVQYLRAAVAGAEVSPEKALTLAVRGRILRTRKDAAGRVWVADERKAAAEEYCCRKIVEAMGE